MKSSLMEIIRVIDEPWEEGEEIILEVMTPHGVEEIALDTWEEYWEIESFLRSGPGNYILEVE